MIPVRRIFAVSTFSSIFGPGSFTASAGVMTIMSSVPQSSDQDPPGSRASTMSERVTVDQRSNDQQSTSAPNCSDDRTSQDSDDEPMVYTTPWDSAVEARQVRDHLIAGGTDRESIILGSELHTRVPQREGESKDDYARRYVENMKTMTRGGVSILPDWFKARTVPNGFRTPDGRVFDLGEGSGATKGEYRDFHHWWSTISEAGEIQEVPEKWKKFEKLRGNQ
nr:hypothetical protein CFP56_73146 [Quercus suber]